MLIAREIHENFLKVQKKFRRKEREYKYSPNASQNGVTDVLVQEFLALFFPD